MATTPERFSPALRRGLVIGLLLAVGLSVAGAAPAALAQEAPESFEIELRVGNDRLVVWLPDTARPGNGSSVEWLQGALLFDATELGAATCQSLSPAGACNDNGGRIDFAAVAPGGIQTGLDLFEVQFPDGEITADTLFEFAPTTGGTPDETVLEATTTTVREVNSESGRPMALLWIGLAGITIVGVGIILRRRPAPPD